MNWKEIIEWDVKNWSVGPGFWMKHTQLNLEKCEGLELGSRHGGIAVFLTKCGVSVICSDIHGPTDKAKELHRKHCVQDKMSYQVIDVLYLPFADHSVDLVCFKSVLGALGTYSKQQKAMSEIYRILRKDGELWFAENLKGSLVHLFFRKKFISWGKNWRYIDIGEVNEFCEKFEKLELKSYGFFAAFGRREWQRWLLGYLDSITNFLIPKKYKYIAFVVAKK
ncbi:MAG: class I SAM-dependent methyltransferase [Anaerohalosphaeraceae bacterium]|nr:class I SAM-dependent methyltransferase [Anaerohalosphaeraceae bacterium]